MTIKKKLILSFLFSALIPMLFVEFLGGYHAKNALEMAQIEKLEAVADLKVEKIQAIYNGLKTDIQVAQQFFNIKTALPTLTRLRNDPNPPDYITAKKRLDDQLQTFQKVKGYIDIMLVDTDGMIVYVTNEKHAGKDLDSPLPDPDHKSFEEGKKGIYFSNIFSNKIEDLPYSMLISAPVKDSQGKIIGVIALEANMDAVFRMIQDQTGLGLTGETMIGRIVGETVQLLNPLRHDKDSTIKRNVVMGSERSIPLQKSALGQEGSGLAIDYRHEEVIAAWRFIPDFHWGMVAKVDKKEAFDSVIQLNRRVAIFGGILFIMVIYIAFNIAKSIAQPIMSLQKGTEIVGGGDLDFRVGTKARDEIGQLSRSFDKMTENIGKISASRNALTQGIQESLKSLQREITEREKAEREARESEARIHSILDTATDAIITIGEKGIIETFNHSAEQIFGYTSREVVGHNISMLMPSPDREKHDGYLSRYMETGKSNILGAGRETLGQRKDASTFPIELSVSKVDQGDRMIFTGIIRDITKQKKADRERQLAATVFNASTEAITITDADKKILSVNPAFSRITGYSAEEVIGKTPQILQSGLLDANFYKKMWDTINTVGHWQGEIMNKRKDGKFYPEWLSITKVKNQKGKVIQYIGLFSDITEKKNSEKKLSALNDDLKSANDKLNHEMAEREQMEIELRMAQKLEAVGQLAAGIAHEINTPMQYLGDNVHFLKTAFEDYLEVIETYQKASLALSEVPGQEALIEEIKEAEEIADLSYLTEHLPKSFERTFEGIERVSTIVKAMKDFSHPDQREKSLTDINKGLTSTLTVARNEYKYVADIKTEFGKLPHILCHAGEINQVFLNLIVNAAHAIGDAVKDTQEKGKIHIKTEVENEDTVLISIQDSGTGIPEEICKRVFDPFFTTKEVGRGTGQGLAIARSTVKEKHGGSLTLESKVGQGTTFFIRLPIHEDDGRNNNGTKPEESI